MDFFKNLKSFSNFNEFLNDNNYQLAPSDSLIIITDVEGSTKAIENGNYKIVNMVGASSIVALANTIGTLNFPFVFGGDGATALISSSDLGKISKSLRAIKRNAAEKFSLNLRIGIVPVRNLNSQAFIGKFQLPGGPYISFLSGGAWQEAEQLVKSGKFLLNESGDVGNLEVILKGLSCRWAPLKNTQGNIISVIIKPNQINKDEFISLIKKVSEIIKLDDFNSHPVKPDVFKQENFLRATRIESALIGAGILKKISILFQLFLVKLLKSFNLTFNKINFNQYIQENPSHSDYKKFDEVIRFVIDCSIFDKQNLEDFLESERKNKKIYYGVFSSRSALLTCFVEGLSKGNHIHFVDGNDGGYAMAAKQLKKQMT